MLSFFWPEQFVPSLVCLSCDGCCRFRDPQGHWRPQVLPGETDDPEWLAACDHGHYLKVFQGVDGYHCLFHCEEDNTCRAYESRPFECRLYPFMLMNDGEGIILCVHLSCSFIQQQKGSRAFGEYGQRLFAFLQRPDVSDQIRAYADRFPGFKPGEEECEVIARFPA